MTRSCPCGLKFTTGSARQTRERKHKKAAAWVYQDICSVPSGLFRLPEHPPELPVSEGASLRKFHPSVRYLSYLKLYFWIALRCIDMALLVGWLALYLTNEQLALWLLVPALFLSIAPDIITYVAIHVRFDTMWYVMADRSLRCRRGIWIILEHTITFENVQNVSVRRGPVQYLFGISTVVVETAGSTEVEGHATGNRVTIEGIDNPDEIRRLIMTRVQSSKSAGLGDEQITSPGPTAWRDEHPSVLREIRDEI